MHRNLQPSRHSLVGGPPGFALASALQMPTEAGRYLGQYMKEKKSLFHRRNHEKINVRSTRKTEEAAPRISTGWTCEIVNTIRRSQQTKKKKG